jgi:hypothetical protein
LNGTDCPGDTNVPLAGDAIVPRLVCALTVDSSPIKLAIRNDIGRIILITRGGEKANLDFSVAEEIGYIGETWMWAGTQMKPAVRV